MPSPYPEPRSLTLERVAVLLYHAQNERVLMAARVEREDISGGAVALLKHRVDHPYRSWEAEDVSTRDYWRSEVDRIEGKLGEEFPDAIPEEAGLCGGG